MTIPQSLTFGFLTAALLSSCAKDQVIEEEVPPTPAPFAPPEIASEAVLEVSPLQNMGFADPDTTSKLITAEETKTFVGEAPEKKAAESIDDTSVKVSPSPLPDTQHPDAPSN